MSSTRVDRDARPCRRRPPRADGRCRSRGASRGRTRPTRPAAPPPAPCGRRRSHSSAVEKPGILPDRPRPPGVHRRPRPAQERRDARQAAEMLEPAEVRLGVERLHRDALGRRPVERSPDRGPSARAGPAPASLRIRASSTTALLVGRSSAASPPAAAGGFPLASCADVIMSRPTRSEHADFSPDRRRGPGALRRRRTAARGAGTTEPTRRRRAGGVRGRSRLIELDLDRAALGRPAAGGLRRHAGRPAIRPADAAASMRGAAELAGSPGHRAHRHRSRGQRPAAPARCARAASGWC